MNRSSDAVVITGYQGFIGGRLTETLLALDRHVIGVARRAASVHGRQGHLRRIQCDLTDRDSFLETLGGERISDIVHLAGGGGARVCRNDPVAAVQRDILGTTNVVELAHRTGARLTFSSSYLAYSVKKHRPLPFTEEMALQPDDLYGALKMAAEAVVALAPRYVILRLSHIYGYHKTLNGLLLRMLDAARRDGRIEIAGSGEHRFSLLYMDDLCDAFVRVLDSDLEHEIFNVGGPDVSILEASRAIQDVMDREVTICCQTQAGYVEFPDHYVSNRKITEKLGWSPVTDLRDGIRATLAELE